MAKKKEVPVKMVTPTLAVAPAGAKLRKVRPDEPLRIVIDAGNADVKAMIHSHFGKEVLFPHSVWRPTGTEYSALRQKFKYKVADFKGTSLFERDGQPLVVGKQARQNGKGITIYGDEKYRVDQMGALIDATLLRLYPEGHSDVRIVVTHPSGISEAASNDIYYSVFGKRTLQIVDGTKATFNVTDLILLEEAEAAFQTFVLNVDGKPYQDGRIKLRPGMEFFNIDIGSWISYMGQGLVNEDGGLEINAVGRPINVGIETVMSAFERELKAREDINHKYPEFRKIQELPRNMLYNALMTCVVEVKGETFECEPEVRTAMNILITALEPTYRNQFRSAIEASAVVVSGGGGGVAFDYLDEKLLNHPSTHMAERDITKMRFGAIRGASKGQIPFLKLEGQPEGYFEE